MLWIYVFKKACVVKRCSYDSILGNFIGEAKDTWLNFQKSVHLSANKIIHVQLLLLNNKLDQKDSFVNWTPKKKRFTK